MSPGRIRHLRIEVQRPPDPFLLRAALEAAAAGRSWPAGSERTVAEAVAGAVAAAVAAAPDVDGEVRPWR